MGNMFEELKENIGMNKQRASQSNGNYKQNKNKPGLRP